MTNIVKKDKEFLFIAGTIGAGKSTIVNKIPTIFPNKEVCIIREYIDWDKRGEEALDNFLNKKIDAFAFQQYVIECYFRQFLTNQADLYVFERHPLESIGFAVRSCTEEQVENLYEFGYNMCKECGIPLPTDCDFMEVTNNSDDIGSILDQIKVRKLARKALFVHVEVDGKVQTQRLLLRGRKSDYGYLMERGREYLRRINMNYHALPIYRYDIKPESFYIFYRRDHHCSIPMHFNFPETQNEQK